MIDPSLCSGWLIKNSGPALRTGQSAHSPYAAAGYGSCSAGGATTGNRQELAQVLLSRMNKKGVLAAGRGGLEEGQEAVQPGHGALPLDTDSIAANLLHSAEHLLSYH